MRQYLDIARRVIAEQMAAEQRATRPTIVSQPIEAGLPVADPYAERMQASATSAIPDDAILGYGTSCAPCQCPALPRGVRLVRYEPKSPPVAIDVCSIVVDVEKFIRTELQELDARLHSPVQIRGGWGVFVILDRLRQVGLELEIDATEKARTEPTAATKTSLHDFGTRTGDGDAR